MRRPSEMPDENAEPRIDRISPKGWMGLLFVVGTIGILLTEEALRGFALMSLILGVVVAAGLYLWHKRHPLS
jgi:hypothetical protein